MKMLDNTSHASWIKFSCGMLNLAKDNQALLQKYLDQFISSQNEQDKLMIAVISSNLGQLLSQVVEFSIKAILIKENKEIKKTHKCSLLFLKINSGNQNCIKAEFEKLSNIKLDVFLKDFADKGVEWRYMMGASYDLRQTEIFHNAAFKVYRNI